MLELPISMINSFFRILDLQQAEIHCIMDKTYKFRAVVNVLIIHRLIIHEIRKLFYMNFRVKFKLNKIQKMLSLKYIHKYTY